MRTRAIVLCMVLALTATACGKATALHVPKRQPTTTTQPIPSTTIATTTTTTTVPIVLTDPNVLIQALDSAAESCTGMFPGSGQEQAFVAMFHSQEIQNEIAGAHGQVSYTLDPAAEALTYIETNDASQVVANNEAAWGQVLNNMIDGVPNTTSNAPSCLPIYGNTGNTGVSG